MSNYADVKAYAKRNQITEAQAKVRCDHFLAIERKIEAAKVCPKCNQPTLEFEQGSYEEGYGDFIFCDNDEVPVIEDGETVMDDCGFKSDVIDPFKILGSGEDFDVVEYARYDLEQGTVQEMYGMDWNEFVENDNQALAKGLVKPQH